MIRAILFDFEGVIHDTFELAYGIAGKIYPRISREEYRDFLNGNIYQHPKVNDRTKERFFALQEPLYDKLVMEASIKKTLLRLKKEYMLFLVTSNKETHVIPYFERSGVPDLFVEVLGEEAHESKHEKILEILREHSIAAGEAVFVTDTTGDVHEAEQAGVMAIAVDYGFHGRDRLEKVLPKERIISDLQELAALL